MANKILVVGMPRSGTSWVMQSLFYLRVPVFGIPHPPGRDPLMQPSNKPFWEHPETLSGNLELLGDSNCAVKVLLRKAISYIDLDPTDKVIFCKRDINLAAQSQADWGVGSTYERNIKVITQWYDKFDDWIGDTPLLEGNIEWAKNNKVAAINAIKNFVGSEQDITDAVGNMI